MAKLYIQQAEALLRQGAEQITVTFGSGQTETSGELFRIGRPVNFPNSIDKNHRVSKFLRTKMNIIDIVPCDFRMAFFKAGDKEAKDKNIDLSGIIPELDYGKAIKAYQNDLNMYGLELDAKKTIGVRLYTTDDTTSTDRIENSFGDNILASSINAATSVGQSIQQAAESFGSGTKSLSKKLTQQGTELTANTVQTISALLGSSKDTQKEINKATTAVMNVLLQGHRIHLPQIWSDSRYDPAFSVTIKLVSPYGHPNAIKEFIIKPLIYLLLLCTPVTNDGVSYGRPQTLSIQGYGVNYTPLGVIQSIDLRRGGNDTSFNIYRQPLSIDVMLSFQFLVEGIAHLSGDTTFQGDFINYEKGVFGDIQKPIQKTGIALGGKATIQTLGKLVESLRPVEPEYLEDFFGTVSSSPSVTTTISSPEQSLTNAVESKAKEINEQISEGLAEYIPNTFIENQDDEFIS